MRQPDLRDLFNFQITCPRFGDRNPYLVVVMMKKLCLLIAVGATIAGCTQGEQGSLRIVVSQDGSTLHTKVIPTEDSVACQSQLKEVVDNALNSRVANRSPEISCSYRCNSTREFPVGKGRISATATTSFYFGPYFLKFRDDRTVAIFASDNAAAMPGEFANAGEAGDYLVESILDRLSDARAINTGIRK